MEVQGYRSHTTVWGATLSAAVWEKVDRDIKSKESSVQFSPFSAAEWLCFTFSRALAAVSGLGREEALPLSNTVFIKAQRPPKVRVIAGGGGTVLQAQPALEKACRSSSGAWSPELGDGERRHC